MRVFVKAMALFVIAVPGALAGCAAGSEDAAREGSAAQADKGAQAVPYYSSPTYQEPTKETPSKETSNYQAPSKETSNYQAPSKETPSKESPSKGGY
jgi:hypothetical protein